ncbi:hypothetical protein HDU67_010096, partial [Dinochytrium kinnereticum]
MHIASILLTAAAITAVAAQSAVPVATADLGACSRLDYRLTKRYSSIAELRACYDELSSPSLLSKAKSNAASYISTAIDFHASLPFAEKAAGIVVRDEVNKIANDNSIKSLLDLENSIFDLQKKLGQASFGYFDNCVNAFNVYQPWALVASPSTNGQKGTVIVGDLISKYMPGFAPVETLLLPFYKTAAPAVDILKYKGYIVESINGRNPWDVAESLGGGSNAFLTPYTFNGSFILDPGTLSAGSPFSDPYFSTDVTYKLKDPVSSSTVDLSIPWAAVSSDDSFGNDEDSYTFDFLLPECLNVSSATIRSPATARFGDRQHQSKLFRRSDTSPHKLSVRQAEALLPRPDPGLLAQMVSVPKEGSRAFAVDNNTAALIFQSNTIYDSVFIDFAEIYPSLINDIDSALAKVRLANPSIKNLIIDVSTSAWNCDHHLLLQYLFSTDYKPLEYNFRLTSPAAKLLTASSRPNFPSNERYFNSNRFKPVEAGIGSILENPVNVSFGDASQPFSR